MLSKIDFYYFSPTGGTYKMGNILAEALGETVREHNILSREPVKDEADGELAVFAVPVFGGRIPTVAADRIKSLRGKGKKAVTVVVYGVRAYDDALLELNSLAESAGFEVAAAGAFIARHSIVPEVGAGRPNDRDKEELKIFADKILCKLDSPQKNKITVPGNLPYRHAAPNTNSPVSMENCVLCGKCADICPAEAIAVVDSRIVTDISKCCMCLACAYNCPLKVRALPKEHTERIREFLMPLKDVDRANEFYI